MAESIFQSLWWRGAAQQMGLGGGLWWVRGTKCRLQNQGSNPIPFVDHAKNLALYFKCHELLSRGFNSRG